MLENVLNVGIAQGKIKDVNDYSVNVVCQAIITMYQYILFKDCIGTYTEYRDMTYEKAYDIIYDMVLKICS